MSKQFFILSSNEGSGGVVKVISTNNSHSINIQLENDFPGRKNCFIILSDGTKEEIGFMYKYSAAFEIKSTNSIDGIYITSGTPEQIILWSGNDKPTFDEEKNKTDISSETEFTFENFFGGGFDWQRVRGNFVMHNYSIIHYILSDENVYRSINRSGYYCVGKRISDDITIIAIALIKTDETALSNFDIDTYTIKSGKNEFEVVCAGIDKTGEFFLCLD